MAEVCNNYEENIEVQNILQSSNFQEAIIKSLEDSKITPKEAIALVKKYEKEKQQINVSITFEIEKLKRALNIKTVDITTLKNALEIRWSQVKNNCNNIEENDDFSTEYIVNNKSWVNIRDENWIRLWFLQSWLKLLSNWEKKELTIGWKKYDMIKIKYKESFWYVAVNFLKESWVKLDEPKGNKWKESWAKLDEKKGNKWKETKKSTEVKNTADIKKIVDTNFESLNNYIQSLLSKEQIEFLNILFKIESKTSTKHKKVFEKIFTKKTFEKLLHYDKNLIEWFNTWSINFEKTDFRNEIKINLKDYIKSMVYNLTILEWEKQFNELWFDKDTAKIENALWIPWNILNSIIERESNYWKELKHSWWSKWMTQLTNSVFDEMWRVPENMIEYFKAIPEDIIAKITPVEAADILREIRYSNKIDKPQIKRLIEKLRFFIKNDKSFNHLLNIVIGWIYLKYLKDNRSKIKPIKYDVAVVKNMFSRWKEDLKEWFDNNWKDITNFFNSVTNSSDEINSEAREWVWALINYNWNPGKLVWWETIAHKYNYWPSVFIRSIWNSWWIQNFLDSIKKLF